MSVNPLEADDRRWLPPNVSIESGRVADHGAYIAPFGAGEWPLAAIPTTPGAVRSTVTFGNLAEPWASTARWLAHRWINFPTPAAIRNRPGSRHAEFPAAQTVRQRVGELRAAIEWLTEQGVTRPSEIDDDHLIDLRFAMRAAKASPPVIDQRLNVFMHWFAQNENLPPTARLSSDLRVDLPAESRGSRSGANKTRRIRRATMGPLAWWASTFVDDFADTILELADRVATPMPSKDASATKSDQARAVLETYLQSGEALPTWSAGSGDAATAYLGWKHGVQSKTLAIVLSTEYAARLTVATTPDCPVVDSAYTGPTKLQPFLHYYNLASGADRWPLMVRMLQTACLILVAYLTGMRSEEVRRLRPGCCPEPLLLPAGGTRHLIHGTVTKRQAEADGLRTGTREEIDAVWATIPLAARAINVAERIRERYASESEFLFNSPYGKTMLDSSIATTEIQHFMRTINSAIETAPIDGAPIPLDTHGPITMRRFRRTLAWYIRNQPEGEVTLGVQLQHVGTVIGGGYAAAGATGWADLLDEEGRENRRKVAENLNRELLEGAGISGPAAARATHAAIEADGVSYMPENEARRLLNAPGLQIYDNKVQLSLCMFDPERALCQRIRKPGQPGLSEPNLLGCRHGCTNLAMTDSQAHALAEEARQLRVQAQASPTPMRNRLMAAADEADERVSQHWSTRVVPTIPAKEDD